MILFTTVESREKFYEAFDKALKEDVKKMKLPKLPKVTGGLLDEEGRYKNVNEFKAPHEKVSLERIEEVLKECIKDRPMFKGDGIMGVGSFGSDDNIG